MLPELKLTWDIIANLSGGGVELTTGLAIISKALAVDRSLLCFEFH